MNRCDHEGNVTRLALCKNVLGMEITNGRQGNCKNKIKIYIHAFAKCNHLKFMTPSSADV